MTDRVALITGGASGIGLATARRLLDAGWKVAIADRDEAALAKARDAVGGKAGVLFTALDVTSEKEAGDVVAFPQGDAHVLSSAPGMRGMVDLNMFKRDEGSAQFPLVLNIDGG